MRPEVSALGSTRHDLLVIGGGILGACLAWDAALRGLKVALVERGELGAATSANSLRIIHGGLRYLVRGDLPRMRESIRERSVLLRIAPGLVEPLRVAIPSGIQGYPGRASLRLALALNDLLSADRNRHLDPARQLPPGRALSAGELRSPVPRALAPWPGPAEPSGTTRSMSRPEHLTRAFVRSATERGGAAVNNACAESFTSSGRSGPLSGNHGLSKPGPLRKLRPGSLSWLQDRGLMSWWRAQRARSRHLGRYLGMPVGLNLVVGRRLAQAASACGVSAPTPRTRSAGAAGSCSWYRRRIRPW